MLGSIASRSGDTPLQGDAIRAVFWSTTNLLSIQSAILVTAGAVLAVAGAYSGTTNLQTRGHLLWHGMWRRLEQPVWKGLASVALIAVAVVAMMWPAGTAAVVIRILAFVAFVGRGRGTPRPGGVTAVVVGHRRSRTRQGVDPARGAWHLRGLPRHLRPALLRRAGLRAWRAGSVRPEPEHRRDRVQRPPTSCATGASTTSSSPARTTRCRPATRASSSPTRPAASRPSCGVASGRSRCDLHYGIRADRLVRKDLSRAPELLGTAHVGAGRRRVNQVLAVVGAASDDSEPYLCHNICEHGALRAEEGFADDPRLPPREPQRGGADHPPGRRSRPPTPSRCWRRATSPTAPTRGSRVRPSPPCGR